MYLRTGPQIRPKRAQVRSSATKVLSRCFYQPKLIDVIELHRIYTEASSRVDSKIWPSHTVP